MIKVLVLSAKRTVRVCAINGKSGFAFNGEISEPQEKRQKQLNRIMWKQIDGYRWPYRINEDGQVQKFYEGKWVALHPYICGARNRAVVKMRSADNRKIEVPVVWLMADAFMSGRKEGCAIIHKDGSKLNNALWNLKYVPRKKCGLLSCHSRRKSVLKIDREGNVVAIYRSTREAAENEFISQNSVSERCLNHIKEPYKLTGYNYQYEDVYGRNKPWSKKKERCNETVWFYGKATCNASSAD